MKFGTKVSAVGHGALILLAIFGLPWFGATEREPIPVTNVSFVSEEAFEKAASAPTETRSEEAPPVLPSPRSAEVPQPASPKPVEVPEPAPEEVEVASPPAALEPPDPPDRVVPRVVTVAPPTASAPPRGRPAPSVPAGPTPQPPAKVEPAEIPRRATEPEPDVEVAQDEPPATVPEAPTEPEATPEPEEPLAVRTSSRPMSRPERTVARVAEATVADEPEPERVDQDDATQAAVLAAVRAAATRPSTTAATQPGVTPATEPSGPTATSLSAGPPLTGSEKEGLKLAVQRCWNVPAGLRDAQSLKVTIAAEFAPDGGVINGAIRLIDPSPAPDGRFQQAYEAARRALIRCAPYSMPRDKYAQWREVEIVFNPEGMVSW